MNEIGVDGHRQIVLCEAIERGHRERLWVTIVDGGTR
jgi:hypothetical protein